MSEFQSFGKIQPFGKIWMTVTQKLHGSNAQILFDAHGQWCAGSRTRWLTISDDNYGFCRWVYDNHEELFNILGPGRHFGEWVGKGINNGEGLDCKKFALFNVDRWFDKPLTKDVTIVPILYKGKVDMSVIDQIMDDLKQNGSKFVKGFMQPEGVVINIQNQLYKKVFTPEETQWTKNFDQKPKVPRATYDFDHLLQPIRLEKLLSKDEKLTREYPHSLRQIASMYLQDLIDEHQCSGDEKYMQALLGQIFIFIKRSATTWNIMHG